MQSIVMKFSIAMLASGMLLVGCNTENPETKQQAAASGFSEQSASELSRMDLTTGEMQSIAEAKQVGLDDASLIAMVKSLHKDNLKFDIGFALQVLVRQGMGATALTELVGMGAIPRWTDDIAALKTAQVGDVAVVEIAKIKFQEKKELLSGGEYGNLKAMGLSDAGLLNFVRKGGTAQQLQKLRLELANGKAEQDALKAVGL